MLALAAPATAAPGSETVQSGQVTATLSWKQNDARGFTDVRVVISRAGKQLVSEETDPRCKEFCPQPANLGAGRRSIAIRNLGGDAELEVLVDLYSGGAHCCLISLIYGFQPSSGTYAKLRHDWGNPGYRLRDLGRDRRLEFVTEDDRFSNLFTSYAESGRPIRIFRYDGRRLVKVTRRFRRQIARHARGLYRLYRRLRRQRGVDLRGVLAGWQADNYLRSRRTAARGWRKLRAAARRGELRRPQHATGPSGRAYLRALLRKLRRFGYAR
jgi:hypothetical protein